MFDILFPAWLTGMILSLITAPLGAFVIWRKMAYFGDTLSHSALLGVALGIFLQINPYIAILILTLLLSIAMVWLENNTQFSVDTLLGIIAHSCLSIGVVTVGLLQNVRVDLMSYLFGDLLSINYEDLIYIGIGAVIVLATLFYFWKPLISTTISPELAQVEGINVKRMRFILMVLTALTIALSMKFVGALIIPLFAHHSCRSGQTLCPHAGKHGYHRQYHQHDRRFYGLNLIRLLRHRRRPISGHLFHLLVFMFFIEKRAKLKSSKKMTALY